ncbi:WD40 repeat-like protein [Aspergillus steynii IBT 23096]|uniref:Probable E3 ubiquitin ligase complex SCF subunit sconB n=1 Tax=Aspergillus steynii IBT 23096 TaxID=1392250 RepID=A0A2I2G4S0_9EURO|nr:WD40 repeat-like protein [Aspergillus steynii IBT 23096]PLB47871.1 WD40 repeat-like protein [Aspergillus steynii IBT 23096]
MSPRSIPESPATAQSRQCAPTDSVASLSDSHPKPVSSNRPITSIPANLLPSAPASPPTPAPSPTPHQGHLIWQPVDDDYDHFLTNARIHFSSLSNAKKQRFLEDILSSCDSQQLSFVSSYVAPRLRKDPFDVFPNELCLRVLSFIDDPKTLARASQVSNRWRDLLNDDITWKNLCEKHVFACRRFSEDRDFVEPLPNRSALTVSQPRRVSSSQSSSTFPGLQSREGFPGLPHNLSGDLVPGLGPSRRRRPRPLSYRAHFKQKYMVESAWNKGGVCAQRYVTPEQGVVTSLHLTSKYIVAAMDNAKIHVYDTNGNNQKTLDGHAMGVWALVPWDDMLVSGGCDRDVKVWDLVKGESIFTLPGHTSTVRCLKMSDKNTAISGSRDTTLRIWDLARGTCKRVLVGHQASVRCMAIQGDTIVSGSYDTTARIWSISEGRCLRTLTGHFSQIYAIAYDGRRVATGSLDTCIRIWDPQTGQCNGILQGHTSLVGQLQMLGDTLVTGGSDGSVRVWSLTKNGPIHRLAAHDNSVTSLQFDHSRIVSGGSDGRVKVWSLETGQLLRELSTPAETVWRVAFEEEKAVIMASRSGRTFMEVWDFSPPPDGVEDGSVLVESGSSTSAMRSSYDTRPRSCFSDTGSPAPQGSEDDHIMPDAPSS